MSTAHTAHSTQTQSHEAIHIHDVFTHTRNRENFHTDTFDCATYLVFGFVVICFFHTYFENSRATESQHGTTRANGMNETEKSTQQYIERRRRPRRRRQNENENNMKKKNEMKIGSENYYYFASVVVLAALLVAGVVVAVVATLALWTFFSSLIYLIFA